MSMINKLTIQEASPKELVYNLSTYYLLSRAIYSAVKLGLPHVINQHPSLTIQTLAKELVSQKQLTRCDANALFRLVRYLAGYGIFKLDQQTVHMTTLSNVLLNNEVQNRILRVTTEKWNQLADISSLLPNDAEVLSIYDKSDTHISTNTTILQLQANTETDLLLELAHFHLLSRAIHFAAQLNLVEKIADGINTHSALSSSCNIPSATLARIITVLLRFQFLTLTELQQLQITALGATLIGDTGEHTIKPAMCMIDAAWWRAVGELPRAIETGEAGFTLANGTAFFKFLQHHPEQDMRFNRGLANFAKQENAEVAAADFPYAACQSIVDIGGGNGGLLIQLSKKYPDKRYFLFDQPNVISQLQQSLPQDEQLKPLQNCQLIPGNFLAESNATGIPTQTDLYIIKGVLHDFNDDEAIKILGNCRIAMGRNSQLAIVERLINEDNQPHLNKTSDILMLALFGPGKERNLSEFKTLVEKAGYDCNSQRIYQAGNYAILLVRPKLEYQLQPRVRAAISNNTMAFFSQAKSYKSTHSLNTQPTIEEYADLQANKPS